MVGFRQPMLDLVGLEDLVEAHWPGIDGVPVPRQHCELNGARHCLSDSWRSNVSIRENRVGLIGEDLEQVLKELPGSPAVSCGNELIEGELGRPVDPHVEEELALGGLYLGNLDVQEADGVARELLLPGLVALHIRQTRDALAMVLESVAHHASSLLAPMKR